MHKKQKLSPTDYNLNDAGSPLIPQSKYLDSKGDFTPKFTSNSKAIYRYTTPPSPIQEKTIPTDLFLDSKGDFVPVFTTNKPFNPDDEILLNLHQNGITPTSRYRNTDEGYTNYMPTVTLDVYYARLLKDNGRLGIRNDGVSKNIFGYNNQPVIVRPIGKRWGADTFQVPADLNAPDYVQKAIDTVAELGESILGRNPATYMDRYASDVVRLLPYANPISIYAAKQSEFQKRNAFDRISTVKYGLHADTDAATKNMFAGLTTISKVVDTRLNPRSYNPLSIFSTPGVIMLNRNAMHKNLNELPLDMLELGALISTSAIVHMAPVAANITKEVINLGTGAAGLIGSALAGLSNPFSGLSNPFADMQNPFAGMTNPFAGMTNPLANIHNPFAKITNPFAGISNPFSKMSNPFSKLSIKGLSLKFPTKLSEGFQGIGNALEPLVGHLEDSGKAVREIAKDFGFYF